MKNTMKKLLSLVLVAMLLVCAVPFQAAAATADITFKVIEDGKDGVAYTWSQAPDDGESATIGDMLKYWYKLGYKEIMSAYIDDGNGHTQTVKENVAETVIKAGETVTVRIVPADKPEEKPAEKPEEKPVEKPEQKFIRFQIKFDDSDDVTYTKIATPENGESAVIANLLTYWFGADWSKTYKFEHAYSTNKKETYTDINTTVYVDDTVTIRLTTIKKDDGKKDDDTTTVRVTFYGTDGKAVSTYNVAKGGTVDSANVTAAQNKADNKTGYTFKGWKIDNNGTVYTSAQVAQIAIKSNVDFYAYLEKDGSNSGTTTKFPWKVYLNIYKDNKIDEAVKKIDITSSYASDGTVSMSEVKEIVKKYYTAKDSDGIGYDGLYLAEGDWAGNFVKDSGKSNSIDVSQKRQEHDVNIIVMITNANAKSTTTKADTTNPKTGDMILIPVIFMLVSGAAIAGVYFYNKKRSAR